MAKETAIDVGCPRCGANRWEPCMTLIGEITDCKRPHAIRVRLARDPVGTRAELARLHDEAEERAAEAARDQALADLVEPGPQGAEARLGLVYVLAEEGTSWIKVGLHWSHQLLCPEGSFSANWSNISGWSKRAGIAPM